MTSTSPYLMKLSLNVLNHLGINLYSNAPAVLSEVVANSYDADATHVWITIDREKKEVTIQDDGSGMTLDDVNDRFLHVGYRRRDDDQAVTPEHKRPVMGRKGIGKLSLFSIAKVVDVYTVKEGGERHGLRMNLEHIKKAIEEEKEPVESRATDSEEERATDEHQSEKKEQYRPEPIDTSCIDFERGTRIVLRELKRELTNVEAGLRKRLARRFSIVGAEYKFQLFINDTEVTPEDRGYFHLLEYVWSFQDDEASKKLFKACTSATEQKRRGPGTVEGYEVTGWIGTAKRSGDLKASPDDESVNRVTLMVRGKLAHEDLLEEIDETKIFRSYLIGEIRADFLDLDDEEDIATSSRQRIIEEDSRYKELLSWLSAEVKKIGSSWTDFRNQEGTQAAFDYNPQIKDWFGSLGTDTRKKAEKLFGKINQLTVNDDRQRAELFSHAVLAFESLRYRDNLDALDDWDVEHLASVSVLFKNVQQIESALYYQIVTQRLQIIDKLQEHMDTNALEKVLQEHLFTNLWLLDPAWERATERHMEKRVGTLFSEIDKKLTSEEKESRVDISFRRFAGAYVIVELKRAHVVTNSYKLLEQIDKYRSALAKFLRDIGSNDPIEIVCVVGKDLSDWKTPDGIAQSRGMLEAKGARVVKYEQLLANARSGYGEYLDRQEDEVGRIRSILDALAESTD